MLCKNNTLFTVIITNVAECNKKIVHRIFAGAGTNVESTTNEEKKAKPFEEWIDKHFDNEEKRKDYMKKNYIPNIDFFLSDFVEFSGTRERLLVKAIEKALA